MMHLFFIYFCITQVWLHCFKWLPLLDLQLTRIQQLNFDHQILVFIYLYVNEYQCFLFNSIDPTRASRTVEPSRPREEQGANYRRHGITGKPVSIYILLDYYIFILFICMFITVSEVNPLRAEIFRGNKMYICILCHSSTFMWHRQLKSFLK